MGEQQMITETHLKVLTFLSIFSLKVKHLQLVFSSSSSTRLCKEKEVIIIPHHYKNKVK